MSLSRDEILAAVAKQPQLTDEERADNDRIMREMDAHIERVFAEYGDAERTQAVEDSQTLFDLTQAECQGMKPLVAWNCDRREKQCGLMKVFRLDNQQPLVLSFPKLRAIEVGVGDLPMPLAKRAHLFTRAATKRFDGYDGYVFPRRAFAWSGEDIFVACEHGRGDLPASAISAQVERWTGKIIRVSTQVQPLRTNEQG